MTSGCRNSAGGRSSEKRAGRRWTLARPVVLFISIAPLGGCWGGGDYESDLPATQQCLDMVGGYCAKMTECALPSDRSRAGKDCAFWGEVVIPCDRVTRIGKSMQSCLDALQAIDCATVAPPGSWPTFPTACNGVLVTR